MSVKQPPAAEHAAAKPHSGRKPTAQGSAGRQRAVVKRDPEGARERVLRAAVAEFADKGLGGARVNEIAARAQINKRMLYHYFGNKEELYLAALESVYEDIRMHERTLHLEDLPPLDAVARLVSFTWDYYVDNPEFLSMLNNENLHRARYLRQSTRIKALHSPFVAMLDAILKRGAAAGTIRADVEAAGLYISIASLAYFPRSNVYTLSTVFDRDFGSPAEQQARRHHIVEVILGYLRP